MLTFEDPMSFKVYYVYLFRDYSEVKPIIERIEQSVDDIGFTHYHFKPHEAILWKRKAREKISEANLMVFFVGKECDPQKSQNVIWELKQAEKLGKKIVIVNLPGSSEKNEPKIQDSYNKSKRYPFVHKTQDQLIDFLRDNLRGFDVSRHLLQSKKSQLENEDRRLLLEQYRLMSSTSEALISRRQSISSFYISIYTALIALVGAMFAVKVSSIAVFSVVVLISIFGFVLSRSWIKTLDAYGLVNRSKYNVMNAIERQLPAAMFDTEWRDMSYELNSRKYESYTEREKDIPKAFSYGFIGAIVVSTTIVLLSMLGYVAL